MNKFSEAICFATKAFDGATRKANHAPAILHSLEAATIVQTVCNDEDVLCAAVLHDTVEDTDITLSEIREKFGERVAFLVESETEKKDPKRNPSETWLLRKERTLQILKESTDIGVRTIWLGDKLSNMRSFFRLKQCMGDGMWELFHQKDPKVQRAYYLTIAQELAVFDGTNAYREYIDLLNKVFGGNTDEN